ncbi:MAG: PorV/PorQ family protein [Gracilimonas sp.]|nr:PorV/PorQ family protein [Gracilimonas sp.]
MKYLSTLIVILFITSSFSLHAQSRVGTTAAPFLTMGVGAKGSALGHANTVSTSGAEALFWNPANIALENEGSSNNSAYLAYNQLFVDVSAYSSGLVFQISEGKSFGIGLNFVDYGRMDIRTVEQQEGTGATFGAHDLSIGVTYAQNLTESFYFGGTAKLVQQKIYDMQAGTIAFDFGFTLLTEYLNGMKLGASISNFGGSMQMGGINAEYLIDVDETSEGNNESVPGRIFMDEWDLPLSFKFGVNVPVIKRDNIEWILLADAHQTNDNDINLDTGSQLSYLTNTVKFHARAGYKDLFLGNQIDSHFTYGAGFTLKTASRVAIGFDFAQVPFDFLGNTTLIDVKLYF